MQIFKHDAFAADHTDATEELSTRNNTRIFCRPFTQTLRIYSLRLCEKKDTVKPGYKV